MLARAVVCMKCRKVIALGAGLPAVCLVAVPPAERLGPPFTLEAHPQAHVECAEMEVLVPQGLPASETLAALDEIYGHQIAAMVEALETITTEDVATPAPAPPPSATRGRRGQETEGRRRKP